MTSRASGALTLVVLIAFAPGVAAAIDGWRQVLERGHVGALVDVLGLAPAEPAPAEPAKASGDSGTASGNDTAVSESTAPTDSAAREADAGEEGEPGLEELTVRAFTLAAAQRHAEAIEAFDAAIALSDGTAFELREGRAASMRLSGDRDRAWSERQALVNDFERGADHPVREIVAVGRAASALGRRDPSWFRTALDLFELAAQQDAEAREPSLAIAELLLDRYNSQEAVEALSALLQGSEPDLRALYLLARTQHFDQSRAAEQTLEALLELDPDYQPALLLRARLRMEAERYEDAAADIDNAMALNPDDLDALALRASLAFLLADGATFEADVTRSRALAPASATIFVTLAEIAARNRRYESAVQFALGAVSVDRYEWSGYVLLGINRMRQGDMEGGRRALEAAFEGDPFNIWAKNTLDLLDKVDGFSVHVSPHFVLSAPADEGPVLAPWLLPIAEEAFATFEARYGHTPRTPIRIEMYASHEDFSVRTAGVVGLGILGVSFGPVVALDSPSAGAFGPTNWASVLWHEIAHSFHLSISRFQSPRWFSEGLAVYEERLAREGWGADPSPSFLRAWAEDRLPPPSGLNEVFLRPEYPEQVVHGYSLGALLIEYIVEQAGFDAINAMLNGFAERRSFADLVTELLETDAEQLDTDFNAWMDERFAAPLASLVPSDEAPRGIYVRHLRAGARALGEKDWDTAERELTLAHAAFPDHAGPDSAMDLLARLAAARGDVEGAAGWLRRSVAIDADDIGGHRRLASHLMTLGREEEAGEIIARSILIEPFDAETHVRLAEIGEARGDWSSAVAARQAVVNLSPTDPVVAGEQLARAQMMNGDAADARVTLLRALERAPLHERGLELLLELRNRAVDGAPNTNAGETSQ